MLVKAVILVGGPSRGTRFRPLSLHTPKPLFPVAGYPLLHHQLRAIATIDGLRDVYLVGYFDDVVFRDFIRQSAVDFPSLTVRYLREYQSLGTAGGLYHFRDEILHGSPDRLFVLHSDVACTFPLNEMLRFHGSHDGWCTILGTRVDRNATATLGCLVADPNTQEVLHYVEKPKSFISDLISCGVYIFDSAIFEEIKTALNRQQTQGGPADRTTLAHQDPESYYAIDSSRSGGADDMSSSNHGMLRLEQDVLRNLAGNQRMFVCETRDTWRQIKTASSAIPVNGMYLRNLRAIDASLLAKNTPHGGPEIVGDVFIHPTARIDASAKIGPNASIGAGTIVGRGCRVRDAIILDNAQLADFSCVMHAVVGWDTFIGLWARIEGSRAAEYDGTMQLAGGATATVNGVKVPTVTILGDHVLVADEAIIRNCIVLPNKTLKRSFKNEILM